MDKNGNTIFMNNIMHPQQAIYPNNLSMIMNSIPMNNNKNTLNTMPNKIYYSKPEQAEVRQKHYTQYDRDCYQRIINMDYDEEVCRINKIPLQKKVPVKPKIAGQPTSSSSSSVKKIQSDSELKQRAMSKSSGKKNPSLIVNKPPTYVNFNSNILNLKPAQVVSNETEAKSVASKSVRIPIPIHIKESSPIKKSPESVKSSSSRKPPPAPPMFTKSVSPIEKVAEKVVEKPAPVEVVKSTPPKKFSLNYCSMLDELKCKLDKIRSKNEVDMHTNTLSGSSRNKSMRSASDIFTRENKAKLQNAKNSNTNLTKKSTSVNNLGQKTLSDCELDTLLDKVKLNETIDSLEVKKPKTVIEMAKYFEENFKPKTVDFPNKIDKTATCSKIVFKKKITSKVAKQRNEKQKQEQQQTVATAKVCSPINQKIIDSCLKIINNAFDKTLLNGEVVGSVPSSQATEKDSFFLHKPSELKKNEAKIENSPTYSSGVRMRKDENFQNKLNSFNTTRNMVTSTPNDFNCMSFVSEVEPVFSNGMLNSTNDIFPPIIDRTRPRSMTGSTRHATQNSANISNNTATNNNQGNRISFNEFNEGLHQQKQKNRLSQPIISNSFQYNEAMINAINLANKYRQDKLFLSNKDFNVLKRSSSAQNILVPQMPQIISPTIKYNDNVFNSLHPVVSPHASVKAGTDYSGQFNASKDVKILDENSQPMKYSAKIENLEDICRYLQTEDYKSLNTMHLNKLYHI